jgi:DNA-binding NarL/FixJ family response regulator
VTTFLEVVRPDDRRLLALDAGRLTIGTDPGNDLVLAGDTTVSRIHAVVEHIGAGFSLRDLGSRNGTSVNGERLAGERALRPGDEIRVGRTRLVFRADPLVPVAPATEAVAAPPELTRRERDVLVALCRPPLRGDVFTEPASIREIAQALVVTDAAVKQHLLRLYDKFAIPDGGRRRVRLANEALARGAVTLAALEDKLWP